MNPNKRRFEESEEETEVISEKELEKLQKKAKFVEMLDR